MLSKYFCLNEAIFSLSLSASKRSQGVWLTKYQIKKNLIRTAIESLLMAITIPVSCYTFLYFAIGNEFDDRCKRQQEWKNGMRERKPKGRKTSNICKQILIRVFLVDLIYACRQTGIQLRCVLFHLEFNEIILLAARCPHPRIPSLRLRYTNAKKVTQRQKNTPNR